MAENFNAKNWFERKVEELNREARNALKDAAQSGEQITKNHIETRGTEKSGKRGRVETGKMRDSVESRVTKDTRREAEAAFGWLDEQQAYFLFQELGTRSISPMYALTDAGEEVWTHLQRDIDRIVRES